MSFECQFVSQDGKKCESKQTLGYDLSADKVLCYTHRVEFHANRGNKIAKNLAENGDGSGVSKSGFTGSESSSHQAPSETGGN